MTGSLLYTSHSSSGPQSERAQNNPPLSLSPLLSQSHVSGLPSPNSFTSYSPEASASSYCHHNILSLTINFLTVLSQVLHVCGWTKTQFYSPQRLDLHSPILPEPDSWSGHLPDYWPPGSSSSAKWSPDRQSLSKSISFHSHGVDNNTDSESEVDKLWRKHYKTTYTGQANIRVEQWSFIARPYKVM